MLIYALSAPLVATAALAAEPDVEAPVPAVAQDEESAPADDDDDAPEDSVKSEREAVKSGKADTAASAAEAKAARKKVIKTIQKKNFMKLGRYEIGPSLGFVANDPFLNRYIVGLVLDYHMTEVFALEAQLGYAPILGKGGCDDPDWKPLSCQLREENQVSPDISRLTAHGSFGVAFAPIYGKAAVGRGIIAFDIYGTFGLGATQTTDDLVALGKENDPDAKATQNQWHPTTIMGGGARVAFSELLAVRFETKSMTYIETIASETLEMKNNLIIQANASFFFPGMK